MPNQPFSPDSFQTFGELLKYLRRRERLTQLELSISVGYSEAQIGRLEKNQRRPDLTALKALFIPALHLEDESETIVRFLEMARSAKQEDAPAPGYAPYKGLLFFDEADADLFFGREVLTAHLADRVTDLASDASSRLLAVVGASGSGKSSLVRAGLVVALKRAGWDVNILTPTENPLKALTSAVESFDKKSTGHALILIDQFEETFTLCRDESERIIFIEKLLNIAQEPAHKIFVIITLRADFYSHCAQYPLLRQAVAAEQEYIGQMTAIELRRAIEEPAKRGGWDFEAGLVDVLLQDVGAQDTGEPEPGALPLLSHALLATWERRRGRTFTLEGYRASGGVRSAIAETAESVFTDQLNQQQQELARDVFLRLTELGEGTEDTRRRAALNELVRQSEEATQLRTVLNTLAEARLITLNEDSAEVAHEALIREWQRLHEWLANDRDGLRLHRHLTESARDWETRNRDAGELYRGARLAQAREWEEANQGRLNESERAFLAASIEQEHQDSLDREVQRQRELAAAQKLAETEHRAATRLRQRAVYLAGAFVLALVLAGVAWGFNRQAQTQGQIALARELSASAINDLSVDPERSILLALQAVKISMENGQPALIEAQDALHRSIQTSRVLATLHGHDGGVWALAVSGDGTRLATVSQDGTAKVWDVATGKELLSLQTKVTENLSGTGAVFTPDGKQLLTVSSGNTATMWDLATGKVLFTLKEQSALILSLAISPDGKTLATAGDEMVAKLWDAATGKELYTLKDEQVSAVFIAFSPDGSRLYTGGEESTVTAWDVGTGKELFVFSEPGGDTDVTSIASSPDGTRVATGDFDTSVKIWDATTGILTLKLFGHSSQVIGMAFSADSKFLASASEDGTIKLWDAETGRALLTLSGHTSGVLSVAFSPNGNQLYTASRDGTVKIWDISPTAGSDWLNLVGHIGRIGSVTYNPDGTHLATFGLDGATKVWDAINGKVLLTLEHAADTRCVGNISYSLDGNRLVVPGGIDPKIFNAVSGAVVLNLAPFNHNVCDIVFSPDDTRLAAGDDSGFVRIYDSSNGKVLFEFTASSAGIEQIAFSPDSKRLATANDDGATVWDATTGKKLLTFNGHGEGVRLSGITFSADGKLIATAGNDSVIRVWDSETGMEVYALIGHTGSAFAVAFSPDGTHLASSSVDRTIKIWTLPGDGSKVETPLTLYGHTGAVYRVAFSPDGLHLATVGRNPIVRIYALNIEELIAIAKSRLTRGLTTEECQKYLHVATCP